MGLEDANTSSQPKQEYQEPKTPLDITKEEYIKGLRRGLRKHWKLVLRLTTVEDVATILTDKAYFGLTKKRLKEKEFYWNRGERVLERDNMLHYNTPKRSKLHDSMFAYFKDTFWELNRPVVVLKSEREDGTEPQLTRVTCTHCNTKGGESEKMCEHCNGYGWVFKELPIN